MKKLVLFSIIFFVLEIYVFSFSYSPDFEADGLVFDFAVDYGKTFNEELRIINVELLFSPFPSRPVTFNYGLLTVFSPDIFILDLYAFSGFNYYPFNKIFSLGIGFGFAVSMYALLNHLPYIINAKANIDIPIYRNKNLVVHNLTFGTGVQHRNAVKIIGYIKSDNYYGMYNSYFFEIGYRIVINKGQN